jgi:hypothetical protein
MSEITGTFTDATAGFEEDLGTHEVSNDVSLVHLLNTWQRRLQGCDDASKPTVWVTVWPDRVMECCADQWGSVILARCPSGPSVYTVDGARAPMLLLALMDREGCTTFDINDATGKWGAEGDIDAVVDVMVRLGLKKRPGRFDIPTSNDD